MLYLPAQNIDWPRSYSGNLIRGRLRTQVDDFQVNEVQNIEFSDAGEHLYLQIEKINLNTEEVRRAIARHFEVPIIDVAYSGLKDKRAIARQWFSVRQPKIDSKPVHKNYRVLQSHKHSCKLRRGTHTRNEFRIVVRDVSGELDNLSKMFDSPFPNYYGSQRFGLYFNNHTRARVWVEDGRPPIPRSIRSRYLSTLRSFLFNELLAQRVKQDNWKTLLEGDPALGNQATGPLWGRGKLRSNAATASLDQWVQEKHPLLCDALEWVGLQQERRPLAVQAEQVTIEQSGSSIILEFSLPPGSYATVGISEYFDCEVVKE